MQWILYHHSIHHDVIKWKHFPRYWPFVRGIHRSPVNSLHKGQWRGALMFSMICPRINGWVNNREAGDLRRHRAHYNIIVMFLWAFLYPLGIHNWYKECQMQTSWILLQASLSLPISSFASNLHPQCWKTAITTHNMFHDPWRQLLASTGPSVALIMLLFKAKRELENLPQ